MASEIPDPTEDPTPCAYTEYHEGEPVEDLPATGEDAEGLEADVWAVLSEIEDPEMPISIVDLGLIYGVDVTDAVATIDMTLTYSGCPARDMLLDEVEKRVEAIDGIDGTQLRLVWSPEWSLEMVTEQGRTDLNDFGLSV
jgi:metal-sulfur cluster biosynthetic enzyme